MKTCSSCGTKYQNVSVNFNKHKGTKDGYTYSCKLCAKKYRKENREFLLIAQKKWNKNNQERMRIWFKNYGKTDKSKQSNKISKAKRRMAAPKSSDLTEEQWFWILDDWDFCCSYCGIEFSEENPPTQDHILPLSRGGSHTFLNITPACLSCNDRKGTKIAIPGTPLELQKLR